MFSILYVSRWFSISKDQITQSKQQKVQCRSSLKPFLPFHGEIIKIFFLCNHSAKTSIHIVNSTTMGTYLENWVVMTTVYHIYFHSKSFFKRIFDNSPHLDCTWEKNKLVCHFNTQLEEVYPGGPVQPKII